MQRHFVFHSSSLLTRSIVAAHLLAMAAFAFVPVPLMAQLSLCAILFGSMGYYVLRDAQLKLRGSWLELRLDGEHVVLRNRGGKEFTGLLSRSTFVTPYLAVVNVYIPEARRGYSVVLMSDSLDAGSFRQLRMLLKWDMQASA
jgi:hypothetical protein